MKVIAKKACWYNNAEAEEQGKYIDRHGNITTDDAEFIPEGTEIEIVSLDSEDETFLWCTDKYGDIMFSKEYYEIGE